jgi:hypothetical protein
MLSLNAVDDEDDDMQMTMLLNSVDSYLVDQFSSMLPSVCVDDLLEPTKSLVVSIDA